MTVLSPGTVLQGRYSIDHLLARGGTSRIYVAHPLHGAGRVALKQLVSSPGDLEEDLRHFRREYELLHRLRHVSLPRALEIFTDGGEHFLAEEFIPGDTLQQRIERHGHLSVDQAGALAMHLLDVLEYLHVQGVIYRDLKPDNVLVLRDGTPRLIDFGAARRHRPGAARDTVLLGTPGFASPEHYGSAQTDARSDIYTVGAVLHVMLTGHDPTDVQPWQFPHPSDVRPEVPSAVGDVAMRALRLNPEERFPSAREMQASLKQALGLSSGQGEGEPLDWIVERRLGFPSMGAYAGGPWGWLSAWSRWRALRVVAVDVCVEGIRMRSDIEAAEFAWHEVERVRVLRGDPGGRHLSADVSGGTQVFHLDARWPAFQDVLQTVIARAGLVDSAPPWSAYTYVGTRVETFERDEPATE